MKRQAYQHPELRDANDNIIQEGTYGKESPLVNSTNDGVLDYINNNLEALYDAQTAADTSISTETLTVSGKTTTGTLDAGDTTVSGSITTTGLTVTGETSVPTANSDNNSTTIATTAFVQAAIAALVDSAPDALNTLKELATALGNDADFSTTVTNAIAAKVAKAGDTITGDIDITGDLSVSGAITGNLAGNADTATNATNATNAINATNDANGNPIAGTYLPLSGGTLTGVVNGVTPPNGDNSKKLATTEFVNAKAGLPVGFQYFQTNPNVPAGSLPLLGGEYSRTTYADLWAWVQTQSGYLLEESAWQAKAAANGGNVPFYSKGNGSTTFRVPALKCWVRGANSINEVGGYLAAGLPNITGSFGKNYTFNDQVIANGAVSEQHYATTSHPWGDSSQSGAAITYSLDASRSSAVYGKSTTVQPESIVGMWVVKAYGTVTNVGSTDVANISTGLTQAETRISALENHVQLPGVVQAFAGSTIPAGWLLCDGSAVSRTDYAALFAVIGTTYGTGDGNTTFNLPNLVDKFVEGSATAGTVKSAGLPNITGKMWYLSGHIADNVQSSGAFKTTEIPSNKLAGGDGYYAWGRNEEFDASRSNSIYGNSATVQPPALTMRYIIKY